MTSILNRLSEASSATQVALRLEGRTLTFSEIERAAAQHVDWLRRHNVRPGESVGVWTRYSVDTCAAILGNLMAGVTTVPLNPKLGKTELEHILSDSMPVAIAGEGRTGREPRAKSDAALLLYTSGTTGAPKGAQISLTAIESNLAALADAWAWTPGDVLVHALPLFHVHGLVLGLLGSLRSGGTMHWLEHFETRKIADALRHGSMFFGVPTMYTRIANDLSDANFIEPFAKARLLVSGSAGLARRYHDEIAARTGRRVLERYGLTETLINCAQRVNEDSVAGEVGAPLPGVELRRVDEEGRLVFDRDLPAEVEVRGPNLFSGYWQREDATQAAMTADGFFRTGDIATLSERGHLRIVGRKSTDLIKTGGYKVGAGEVEAALLDHPSVVEVAVLGQADDDLGERIVAYVVPSSEVSEQELIQYVAAQLSPHKRPRQVRFVESLPRNAMGKVQKRLL